MRNELRHLSGETVKTITWLGHCRPKQTCHTHTWSAKRRRRWLIKTIEPLPVHLGDYGVIKIFYYKKECGEREIIVCLSLKETIVGVAINPLENPPSFLPGDRCWSVCPHTHTPALHFSEKSTKLDEDDRILENVFFFPPKKKGAESPYLRCYC